MGEEGPGAAAVVLAACVEVSGISPGNIDGDCGFVDAGALIAPVRPLVDPVVVVDLDAVPDADSGEGDDSAGSGDVGTLSGSDPTAVTLPTGGPLTETPVWACAVVMPRSMVPMMKERCIALSPALNSTAKLRRRLRYKTTSDPKKMKMKIGKGGWNRWNAVRRATVTFT